MAKQTVNGLERKLKSIARRDGTPVMVMSKSALLAQIARFRKLLPRVDPYFAIKANPHPDILKIMVGAGVGFDVASIGEMREVLKAGGKAGRIIFANTIKPAESIAQAVKHGVDLMTFDSEYELDKIAEQAPGARVVVRTKVPNIGSTVELSLKFGVDPSDAIPLLIKAYKLGLKPAGVSFHVGSQCVRQENYVEALEIAAIIFRDAQLKQIPLSLLDIGGGFPIVHMDDDVDQFEHLASVVSREIARLFEPNIKVIAEPGRFLVGPAGTLVMSVIGKAIRENKHWYYLDDGVYHSLSGIIFDHCKYQYKVMKRGRTQLSTLAGPTCDSLDIISRGEEMPELELGDLVYVENIGAYSAASATWFNGLPPARTVMTP